MERPVNDRPLLVDLLRNMLLGACVLGVALLLFGVAEITVNTAVGLYQPLSVWSFVLAIYASIGAIGGLPAGAVVGMWRRLRIGPALEPVPLLVGLFLAVILFVIVGLPLNDRVLPGFFAPISLVSNGALFLVSAAIGALAYRVLAPLHGAALGAAIVNLVFWFCLCLSAGLYIDEYIAAASASTGSVIARYVAVLVGCFVAWVLFARALAGSGGRPWAGALAVLVLGLGFLFGDRIVGGLNPTEAGREGKPNVLWIVMDTTRPDHLSVYGYERDTSPALTKLMSDGVVFETAVSQAPWTMPSHFQMVTSIYESGKETVLKDEYVTAAEIFRDDGYDTGAVLGNFSLGRRSGFAQGFDTVMDGPVMVFFHQFMDKLPAVKALIRSGLVSADTAVRWFHRHTFLEGVGARGSDLTDRAIRWMTSRGDKPFFLFVNYMDPHDGYDPPEPYRTRFADGVDPIKGFVRWDHDKDRAIDSNTFVRDKLPKMQPKDWQELIDLYDGEIAFLDAQLGRMFDVMRERGILDNTIVVITADHGELFGEHGLAYHFKSLSEEETHVPLLMRYPGGLPAGARIKTPVEVNDVLPTLVELSGAAAKTKMQGESLVTLAKQGDGPDGGKGVETFTYLIRKPDKRFAHTQAGHLFGRKTGGDKYVWSSGGQNEFYELAQDPKAHDNEYAADKPEIAVPAERVTEFRKQHGLEDVAEQKLDRATREKLKALGYID
jgi:arylsulfatase A-like enzyme